MAQMRRKRLVVVCSYCLMERSVQFREFADECERLAEEVTSDDQRLTLRKIALAWRRVAEEYEQRRS
jgi:hypothetical protein